MPAFIQPGIWRFDAGRTATLNLSGRIDRQVKIRGFRADLDGIEATLRKHPLVADAVVVHDHASSQRGLIAYLIPRDAAVLNSEDVRHFVRTKLPDYMVPRTWMLLESVPRDLSGKVDRRALPPPQKSPLPTPTLVPPQTPTEAKIADLWCNAWPKGSRSL